MASRYDCVIRGGNLQIVSAALFFGKINVVEVEINSAKIKVNRNSQWGKAEDRWGTVFN